MKIYQLSLIKTSVFCVFLFVTTYCSGQDTISHYPTFQKKGNHYLYGDKRINEAEMQTQLVLLGNTEITNQVRLARKSKELQGIGYYAIPLGIFATYLGIASQPLFWKSYEPQKEKMSQACYGATFLVLTSSVYFKIDSDKKNARALRLYHTIYQNQ